MNPLSLGIGMLLGAFFTGLDLWAGGSQTNTFWILLSVGAFNVAVGAAIYTLDRRNCDYPHARND